MSDITLPAPRRSRRLLWISGAALIALAAAGTAITYLPREAATAGVQPASPAPIPVAVATVSQRETTLWNDFSGRVEAVGRVEIRPRAAGAIVAAHFREGSLVREGDLLFTIDPAPYAAELRRAEAQVAAATAALTLAQREQGRALSLVGSGAVAQRDADQRVSNFREAEANLRSVMAGLDTAKLNLGYTEVRAPISGRVGKIEVTQGNLVPAGPTAPVLTTLVSVSPIYASFEADEQSVARAMASLPEGAGIERIPVEMGTLGVAGTPFRGRLQMIDNVVDARSGTIRLRAAFDNEDGRLLPGQFARLRLGNAKAEPVLAIDEQAIGTDQDRRYVLVVGEDSKAMYRAVTLGATVDGKRVVTAGLKSGERIVVNGLQRIRPGALVAPQLAAMVLPATPPAARSAAN